MKEYGIVVSTKGKKAKVDIKRHAMCGECGACQVGKDKMSMRTTAVNQADAKVGDAVAVEMTFGNVMKASGIAYGFPLIAFLAGCFGGYYFAAHWGYDPVLFGFSAGIILTLMAYIAIMILEKRKVFGKTYEPLITEVVDPAIIE